MGLHRDVSVEMVECTICLVAPLEATAVHAFNLLVAAARAFVLLRSRNRNKRVHLVRSSKLATRPTILAATQHDFSSASLPGVRGRRGRCAVAVGGDAAVADGAALHPLVFRAIARGGQTSEALPWGKLEGIPPIQGGRHT